MSAHFRKLEHLYCSAPINAIYEPQIEIGEGRASIEIDVGRRFWHAAHAVHGSVYFKMLDDAAFFASNSLVEDVFVLTASFHTHFLRPVATGRVRSVGRVISRSRRLVVAEAELFDEQDREIGRGSGSFMPSRIALTGELGYRLDDGRAQTPGG